MLPSKVQQLLAHRPKLIGSSGLNKKPQQSDNELASQIQKSIDQDIIMPKIFHTAKVPGLNLGLDHSQQRQGRLIKVPILQVEQLPGNSQIQATVDQSQIISHQFIEQDIDVEDYLDRIPRGQELLNNFNSNEKVEDEPINYIVQEEQTKMFLIDALATELQRLDTHSLRLEGLMGENQKIFESLRNQNTDLDLQVKTMVQEKRTEDRIRRLEDGLKYVSQINDSLDDHLRMKLDDRMDVQRFNDELEVFYEDNEALFQYADKVMMQGRQQQIQETEPDQVSFSESSYIYY